MHDRRSILAMTGAASLLPGPLSASQREDFFDAALAGDGRLLGWATPPVDYFESRPLEIEGTWPADLQGTFRRIGPAAHSRHGLRYRHWFDADGMIQEFRLDGSGITHRGRMLETPKLTLEDREGKRLLPAFATRPEGARPVRRADDMNVANTALLDHRGELLALWEGGSASIIDRESLSWEAFKSWGEGLEGLPFTAHPKVEPDGTLWAFGLVSVPYGALVLYHIPGNGAAVRAEVVPLEQPGFVHDFVVTRDFLVIVIPPFVHDPQIEGTYLESHAWKPELGSRVLVVRKDDFSARRWIQLPAAFGFHHGNGWNEDDGTIHFDFFLADDPSLLEDAFTEVMDGLLVEASVPRFARIVLRPDGSFAIAGDDGGGDFPTINPARVSLRHRYLYSVSSTSGTPAWLPGALEKRDLESGRLERFDPGKGIQIEEHLFIPFQQATKEDDGWLIGSFLDSSTARSGVAVFDARGVADGPLAQAWLPFPLPLGFHGQFSPA
ncbi:MAG: carotenoid oxygenase family protein [bacterium]|nr:carotenoid oxygenase family protein [bacterium]